MQMSPLHWLGALLVYILGLILAHTLSLCTQLDSTRQRLLCALVALLQVAFFAMTHIYGATWPVDYAVFPLTVTLHLSIRDTIATLTAINEPISVLTRVTIFLYYSMIAWLYEPLHIVRLAVSLYHLYVPRPLYYNAHYRFWLAILQEEFILGILYVTLSYYSLPVLYLHVALQLALFFLLKSIHDMSSDRRMWFTVYSPQHWLSCDTHRLTLCKICFTQTVDQQQNRLCKLPCGHIFHGHCMLDRLMAGDVQCPLCQLPVPTFSPHPLQLHDLL